MQTRGPAAAAVADEYYCASLFTVYTPQLNCKNSVKVHNHEQDSTAIKQIGNNKLRINKFWKWIYLQQTLFTSVYLH